LDEAVLTEGRDGMIAGFMSSCEKWDTVPEMVGVIRAVAWPSGRLTQQCWQDLLDQCVSRIRMQSGEGGGLDAVYLALHGAMVVDGEDDPEGLLCQRVREVVGP
jgi:microcystin degradation protein MlrC